MRGKDEEREGERERGGGYWRVGEREILKLEFLIFINGKIVK